MEKKIILSTLGGFAALFLLGGLVYAVLLAGMYEEWMRPLGDCVYQGKEMPIYVPIAANLFLALLYSLIYNKFGVATFKTGAIHGIWIGALISLWFDTWMFGTLPSMTMKIMIVDVIANVVLATLAGGVIGWILGKVK